MRKYHSSKRANNLKDMSFGSIGEVSDAVESAVRLYDNGRPNMIINMLTPAEALSLSGNIPRRWRSYRAEAIKNKSHVLEYSWKVFTFASING